LDGSGINLIGTIPQPRTHERSKFHYALHNDRRGGSWRVIPSTWLWFENGGRPSIPPLPGSCALRTVGKSQNRLWAFPLPPSPPDLHLPDFTAIPRHFRFSSHPSQTERERDDHRREIPRPCVTLPKRREITVAMPMQGPSSAQSSWGFSAQESSRRRSSPCRLGAENEHTQVGPRQANNLGSHLLPGNPLVPEKFQTFAHSDSAVGCASRLIAPFSSSLILPPFPNMPAPFLFCSSSPPSTRFRDLLFGIIVKTVTRA
jgi:hypothetical protein